MECLRYAEITAYELKMTGQGEATNDCPWGHLCNEKTECIFDDDPGTKLIQIDPDLLS